MTELPMPQLTNITDGADNNTDDATPLLREIVLVTHNGNRFDIPFLFKSFISCGIDISESHSGERLILLS